MTPPPSQSLPALPEAQSLGLRRWRPNGRQAGAWALGLGGASLAAVLGGWPALVGAGLVAAAMVWGRSPNAAMAEPPAAASPDATPAASQAATAATPAVRQGAEVMVAQIVPVWERQLLSSRDVAEQGLAKLLEAFAGISGAADEISSRLAQVAAGGGVDSSRLHEHPALQALQSVAGRAFAERDAAVAVLARSAAGLDELQQGVKQLRELARHTRLVAFNASIESQRQGEGGGHAVRGGSQAVSVEIRTLSARMGELAEQLDRTGSALLREVSQSHREAVIHTTGDEELRLEVELRAREALQALGGELGQTLAGSGALAGVGEQLSGQIGEAFTHFQFGDRLSQMLAILANDMSQLVQWVQAHPVATRQDAAEWLEALEASYTMEEQRSQHHGNVHVDRSAGAEFF